STDFDRTNFYETLPCNRLALALWLESDRMAYLPDKLDQANLSNQQDVVRNERRQSMENAPYGIVEEGMFHLLYPKGHPYYGDVMGSHEDRKSTRLNSSHGSISYAVFCLKKKISLDESQAALNFSQLAVDQQCGL